MTAPDTGSLALLQSDVRHLNDFLIRIERKIDKVTDDHEARLRKLEAADPDGTRLAVKALQESDKRWAAAAMVLAVVVPTVLKLIWP
jgi:hypothetical protein